ncbi:MAG: HAD family hydrolase [Bacilli bacterium]|jgi:phosphoglycolate phosphatase
MIKNLVFDLDGTLLDTIEEITKALNETLIDFSLPEITVAEGKSFLGHGTEHLLRHALKGAILDQETYQSFKDAYMKRQIVYQLEATRPFPGVLALINDLINRGMRLFVYSNKPHPFAVKLIEARFPGAFEAVIGQQPGHAPKPNVAPFLPILEKYGVDPQTSVYVGDSLVDIKTAAALGMRAAAVTWGYVPRERLLEAQPAFIIDRPGQLLQAVINEESQP